MMMVVGNSSSELEKHLSRPGFFFHLVAITDAPRQRYLFLSLGPFERVSSKFDAFFASPVILSPGAPVS